MSYSCILTFPGSSDSKSSTVVSCGNRVNNNTDLQSALCAISIAAFAESFDSFQGWYMLTSRLLALRASAKAIISSALANDTLRTNAAPMQRKASKRWIYNAFFGCQGGSCTALRPILSAASAHRD